MTVSVIPFRSSTVVYSRQLPVADVTVHDRCSEAGGSLHCTMGTAFAVEECTVMRVSGEMRVLDLQKVCHGLTPTWLDYLRDWDRTLRAGNYPQTTRNNDIGSPRVAGATKSCKACSTPGCTSPTRGRPAPGALTRPSQTTPTRT